MGHVPEELNYKTESRTFTFVTKASFEGTDFYSDSSSTYVFADPNKNNMSIDIPLEMRQIAGRCRTISNPFRRIIHYYYKTTMLDNIEETRLDIKAKKEETYRMLQLYGNNTDTAFLNKFRSAQPIQKYKNDYLEVVNDENGIEHLT